MSGRDGRAQRGRVLTPSGRAVGLGGAALVVVGMAAGYPELVLVGAAGVMVVVAALAAMASRVDMTVTREITPVRVPEGDDAFGVLTVENRARRRSPGLIAVEAVGGQRVTVALPGLRPGGRATARYRLPTDRRGIHQVGPLTLARSDPLRLTLAATEHPSHSVLAVLPRVHGVEPVPSGRSRDMDGPTTATSPQGGIVFHSLREYVPGDDLRLIHWRSTARTGSLMVRHNVVPHEPRVMVVLDTRASSYQDDAFEDAVRMAASLSVATLDQGAPLRLRTTGGASALSGGGGAGREVILELLAGIEAGDDDPGLASLGRLASEGDGASLAVVTGHPPPEEVGAVPALRNRYDMVAMVRVGAPGPASAGSVPASLAVDGRTSEDAAGLWNARVRR